MFATHQNCLSNKNCWYISIATLLMLVQSNELNTKTG